MSTILLWLGGIALTFALLLSLPLVKHITKPILDESVKLLGLLFAHTSSYVVWMFKSVFNAHVTVVAHLLRSKKHFDPTDEIDLEK